MLRTWCTLTEPLTRRTHLSENNVLTSTLDALLEDMDSTLDSIESAVDDIAWGILRIEGEVPPRLARALATLDGVLLAHGA